MLRIISTLVIPLALLVLAIFLYPKLDDLLGSELALIKFLPLLLAGISLSLCLRFNRSLIFFITLAVVSVYAMLQWYLPRLSWVEAKTVWMTLGLLLPLNIMVISLLKERGTFTWWGFTRFAFLLLPIVLAAVLAKHYPELLLRVLTWRFADQYLLNPIEFAQVPLAMMVMALLILNGRWFIRPNTQNGSVFMVLISAIAMLHFNNENSVSAVFASTAMVMLIIAVVQESWHMAYIDPLTSLPGRRALDEDMLKLGNNYAIAMLDIDHFKKFNDTYGHDTGDQVLQMVAARIKKSVSAGKVYRYGGEEFTVLFSGKKAEETIKILDAVRESIGDSKFQLRKKDRRSGKKKNGGKKVQVTISIGVAERAENMTTPQAVIKGADKALYRAKKKGRNQVCQ